MLKNFLHTQTFYTNINSTCLCGPSGIVLRDNASCSFSQALVRPVICALDMLQTEVVVLTPLDSGIFGQLNRKQSILTWDVFAPPLSWGSSLYFELESIYYHSNRQGSILHCSIEYGFHGHDISEVELLSR